MKTSLLTTISYVLLLTSTPVAHAFVDRNPAIQPLNSAHHTLQHVTNYGEKPRVNHRNYYGIPEKGVQHLTKDRREQMLQELSQRVINLQKIRNRSDISPTYTQNVHIYERLLRRTQNLGIAHYRSPEEKTHRLLWQNGKLVSIPRLTPADIHGIVDVYEYERTVRGTEDDHCKLYSGDRRRTCRYLQRIDNRNSR